MLFIEAHSALQRLGRVQRYPRASLASQVRLRQIAAAFPQCHCLANPARPPCRADGPHLQRPPSKRWCPQSVRRSVTATKTDISSEAILDCLRRQDGIGKCSGGVLVAIRLERNSQACKNAGCIGLQGFANCDAVLQCGGWRARQTAHQNCISCRTRFTRNRKPSHGGLGVLKTQRRLYCTLVTLPACGPF